MKKRLKFVLNFFKKIPSCLYNRMPYTWASFLCIIYGIISVKIYIPIILDFDWNVFAFTSFETFETTLFLTSIVFACVLIEDKLNLRIKFKIIENSKIYKSIMTILLFPFYIIFMLFIAVPLLTIIFSPIIFIFERFF